VGEKVPIIPERGFGLKKLTDSGRSNDSEGIVVVDSRRKGQNENASFSIFTKKFKSSGDEYPHILETLLFGHFGSHIGLQMADILVSALLFPILSHVYCKGHVPNVHVHPHYMQLKTYFSARLKALQYRYKDGNRCKGGITVSDRILRRSSSLLFRQ
jgi:hypothetical protein